MEDCQMPLDHACNSLCLFSLILHPENDHLAETSSVSATLVVDIQFYII